MVKNAKKVTIATLSRSPSPMGHSSDSGESVEEIPNAQPLMVFPASKELPNTQDVMKEIGLEPEADPAMKAHQRAQTQSSEDGSLELISMLELLELLWTKKTFFRVILVVLEQVEKRALKTRNLPWKRAISTMRQGIMNAVKGLSAAGIELNKCSFQDFKQGILNGEYCTMFTKKSLFPKLVDLIMEVYTKNIEEQHSSSSTTETTTTWSTTAPTATTPATAQPSTSGNPNSLLDGDILDAFLPMSTTQSNTGLISQFISRKVGDNTSTWTSPGETGYQVIKLEIYPYSKICGVEKSSWWKHAEMRTIFMTNGPLDPRQPLIQKIVLETAKSVTAIPGTQRSERQNK